MARAVLIGLARVSLAVAGMCALVLIGTEGHVTMAAGINLFGGSLSGLSLSMIFLAIAWELYGIPGTENF